MLGLETFTKWFIRNYYTIKLSSTEVEVYLFEMFCTNVFSIVRIGNRFALEPCYKCRNTPAVATSGRDKTPGRVPWG